MLNIKGQPITWEEMKFLFIFCPNNCGTTAMSQYVEKQLSAERKVFLPPMPCEGQQLRGVKGKMMGGKHWATTKVIDFVEVRKIWETYANQRLFIEASPPNIVRPDMIAEVFGDDSAAITSICNPYQQVASSMRRYRWKPAKAAVKWVKRAKMLRHILKTRPHLPFVSYEQFTFDPTSVNRALGIPVIESADIEGKRGSDIKGVRSGYARAIGFLSRSDVITISRRLEKARGLTSFFGYDIRGPGILAEVSSINPEEFNIGRNRRALRDAGVPPP